MRPADTTVEAQRLQREALARLGPERRTELAVEMSEAVCEMARAAIRRRNPTASEQELRLLVIERLHGPELAAAVRAAAR